MRIYIYIWKVGAIIGLDRKQYREVCIYLRDLDNGLVPIGCKVMITTDVDLC